jgi:RNA recognition motif-containing protein
MNDLDLGDDLDSIFLASQALGSAFPGGLPSSYCLFLGDLSMFCTEEDLRQAFIGFGELADVRIKRNKTTKKNLSYGFVEYVQPTCAVKAMNEMNGKIFCGRALR